ncbi:hypothetical protein OAN307_c40000 [Octadecabacter antarcticus 307]|uniref:Uncharacterized protein n=1 Tax=Octadecabacter antarcticus 307 TaxID=391626 RepID=M9RGB7_9RHOB|nr:hypothetical protein OAN307_c40000 [Octadecabacter antarcticus 307]
MMVHKSAAKIKTPRRMVRALKPAKLIGTWFAESIRASGQKPRKQAPLIDCLAINCRAAGTHDCF